ncbi:hypothetical protein [Virgibacillus sp. YIM 98842]|uniref:hypothetical protein n=1 Tax=Virgibacillus sp. YIM 98842 TaxID=2663533 RepID=UPI0013DC57F6|nr:hypothetical protein [Virgibacillus sp. YIM 98842]
MRFEIKSKTERLKNGEVASVVIGYSAFNDKRTAHGGGRFELSPNEYEDKSNEDLKGMAKEHFLNELNAE